VGSLIEYPARSESNRILPVIETARLRTTDLKQKWVAGDRRAAFFERWLCVSDLAEPSWAKFTVGRTFVELTDRLRQTTRLK
jgi:hypothetical protein